MIDHDFTQGYYWCFGPDKMSVHVVYWESDHWYVVGVEHAIQFDPAYLIAPIPMPPIGQPIPGETIH
jgi:hypothetical protein